MPTADDYVTTARSELGYLESPAGSNRTKFAAEAGHTNGQAWCATFCVAIAKRIGLKLPGTSAFTPALADWFRSVDRFSTTPSKGALAFFDFPDSKHRIQHVGIVVSWTDATVTCVEGNTAKGTKGSQDNGGGVFLRTRKRSLAVGFGAPVFSSPGPAPAPPAETQVHTSDADEDEEMLLWL